MWRGKIRGMNICACVRDWSNKLIATLQRRSCAKLYADIKNKVRAAQSIPQHLDPSLYLWIYFFIHNNSWEYVVYCSDDELCSVEPRWIRDHAERVEQQCWCAHPRTCAFVATRLSWPELHVWYVEITPSLHIHYDRLRVVTSIFVCSSHFRLLGREM